MNIFQKVEDVLSAITPAVPFAAGRYIPSTGGQLPDVFITYFLVNDSPLMHADDTDVIREERVQLSIYSRTGLTSIPDVTTAMKGAGFSAGPIRQLPVDQQTGHYHLALEFVSIKE